MNIKLKDIKEHIQKYVNVIMLVTGIDVEVMDIDFIRIAATGRLKKKIGDSMENASHIYRKTISDNKMKIVTNPREEEICDMCESKAECKELIELSMPISLEGHVLGVIGLICFEKKQKDNFLKKQENYILFLEQMADIVKAKLYEYYQKELSIQQNSILNRVFNKINDAVIVVDKENKIINSNAKANSILGTRKGYGKIEIVYSGDTILYKKEFKIKYNDVYFDIIGEIVDHHVELGVMQRIIIFKEKKEYQNDEAATTYLQNERAIKNFIYVSPQMKLIDETIKKVALTNSTVLITGESGTGKEIAARTIHFLSQRREKPFVAINCGAIPEALLESELFGYVKGAFTGADPQGKMGKFELSSGGVLFLDEIGDMPLYMQVKLLRVLQEKKITRVGSNKLTDVDVRIIAATNKNLEYLIETGEFREDLFYRLNVIPIEMPALREREGDIERLALHFANKYSKILKVDFKLMDFQVMEKLKNYSWPGNIRELENTIEYMVNHIAEDGIIYEKYLPKKITLYDTKNKKTEKTNNHKSIKEFEEENIRILLKEYGTSLEAKKKIAKILNIGIATLYRKIELYKID